MGAQIKIHNEVQACCFLHLEIFTCVYPELTLRGATSIFQMHFLLHAERLSGQTLLKGFCSLWLLQETAEH